MRQMQQNSGVPQPSFVSDKAASHAADEIFQEIRPLGKNDRTDIYSAVKNYEPKSREEPQKPLLQELKVKYLGQKDATGLWGIKPTFVSDKAASHAADEIFQEIRPLGKNDRTDIYSAVKNYETKSSEEPQKSLLQELKVKYLGQKDATGLWGIKHTRKPVDEMVIEAKQLTKGKTLPFLNLSVSENGINITELPQNLNKEFTGGFYPIEIISYGVQDLVYTRVFAMIVVREEAKTNHFVHPFQCHAFVCDSRSSARKLTFALAEAFQQFSKKVKDNKALKPKRFAIDLRSPEEMEADLREVDSEA